MTKPRLVKVRALFYVFKHITKKRDCVYFDTASISFMTRWAEAAGIPTATAAAINIDLKVFCILNRCRVGCNMAVVAALESCYDANLSIRFQIYK